MAYTENKKADGLDALTSLDTGDLLIVADASDSYRAKKITKANILDTKADLASPAFTGNPTAPTQTASDNSTKLATTAYVDAKGVTQTSGIASKDLAGASTTQTITHGLGKTPGVVKLTVNISNDGTLSSNGVFDSSGNRCVWNAIRAGTSTEEASGNSTTYSILLGDLSLGTPPTTSQTGVVTVDGTNITITWTKAGTPTGTYSFMWEAI